MIAAILPCRGRHEQTLTNITRLNAHSGRVHWNLVCVIDRSQDQALGDAIDRLGFRVVWRDAPFTYWQAMAAATAATDQPLLANLANDLLPGRDWLSRCAAAYRARYAEGDGLMGFNDGIHGPQLSPHFLIARRLLARYGGWPTHYQHTMGDAELCERAKADGVYAKAPWAVLYHNHPLLGAAHDDVYAAGEASIDRDYALFHQRLSAGWK